MDLTFLRTASQVHDFAGKDRLERLTGNENYSVGRVSFPYARTSVRLFIERLSAQYRAATGEVLVITSLTRPTSMQPRNASPLSVHPTGIAVDLRIPTNRGARAWLEKTLLSLERTGVLDATRERRPPHYHVAVFPDEYEQYVGTVAGAVTTSASLMLAGVQSTLSAVPGVTSLPTVQTGPSLEPGTSSTPLMTLAFAFVIIGVVGGAATVKKARV